MLSHYFQPLMKRLRSYITKMLVGLLICSGLGLSWVQPAQAHREAGAFLQWLDMMVPTNDAPDLHNKLQKLGAEQTPMQEVLKRASRILANQNQEFENYFSKGRGLQSIYQVLLIEWSQYQVGNTMASFPAQYDTQRFIPYQLNKVEGTCSGILKFSLLNLPAFRARDSVIIRQGWDFTVIPMSGGIAIGAP